MLSIVNMFAEIVKIIGSIIGNFGKFIFSSLQHFMDLFGLFVKSSDLFYNVVSIIPDTFRPIILELVCILFVFTTFKILKMVKDVIL